MLYDTKEKMAVRKAELEQPRIDALMSKASKLGGRYNKYHAILAREYGIEGDGSERDYNEPRER